MTFHVVGFVGWKLIGSWQVQILPLNCSLLFKTIQNLPPIVNSTLVINYIALFKTIIYIKFLHNFIITIIVYYFQVLVHYLINGIYGES
jgi:hypothetical protein